MTDRQIMDRIETLQLELKNRQLSRQLKRMIPVGAVEKRADLMRQIPEGGFADFGARTSTEAASIRGSAYQSLGRGRARCVRVSSTAVRVYRLGAEKTQ